MEKKVIGIMQPYFFPYIGYWQLMNAVDEYVVYDDVNFIKGGWINRNRILVNEKPQYINVILSKPSPNSRINEIEIGNDERLKRKLLLTISNNYHKAPYYDDVFPMLERTVNDMQGILSEYLYRTFVSVTEYLEIKTKFILSSNIEKDNELKGKYKVIDICKRLGATDYINAIGGMDLYDYESFEKEGIRLSFLKTEDIKYKQFGNEFVPGLSIIDVMMFNSKKEIQEQLRRYTLIDSRVHV